MAILPKPSTYLKSVLALGVLFSLFSAAALAAKLVDLDPLTWNWRCQACKTFPSLANAGLSIIDDKQLIIQFSFKDSISVRNLTLLGKELKGASSPLGERLSSVDISPPLLTITLDGIHDPFMALSKLDFKSIPDTDNSAAVTNHQLRADDFNFDHIVMNLRSPLLMKRQVRHALALATPKEEIIAKAFGGEAIPAASPVHPRSPFFSPDIVFHPHDPEKARRKMSELWERYNAPEIAAKDARLPLLVVSDPRAKTIARLLAKAWAKLGFQVQIVVKEPEAFRRALEKRNFPGAALLSLRLHPHASLFYFYHSEQIPVLSNRYQGFNIGGWISPGADKVLTKLKNVIPLKERIQYMAKFQKMYTEDLPSIPLLFRLKVSPQLPTLTSAK